MKITVLNDNAPGKGCLAEFGLSYLIEADRSVLLDTGITDIFIQNAVRLNISLDDVDTIVLSHGHYDHGNGLQYLRAKKLICHPDVFMRRYNKKDNSYIGLNLTEEDARRKFDIIFSRTPYNISPEIIFLGEIPRYNDFEAQITHFKDDTGADDFVPDDSALAITTSKGLVVISGCAHAGICNTIDYAREVTGISTIHAVMGGFHLRSDNEQTRQTIDYLKKLKVEKVYPSHCTALPALAKFYEAFNIHQVLTGDYFYFG
jgi:7,8-dihydropterin-6-yl-methyl-4-(beta-D-ribofuranosyl)aminobenzene 5'-phosphate synthase